MAAVFDTLEAAKHLQEAGFERTQAEAIVKVMRDGEGELATKSDIESLRKDLKNDINWLKWLAGGQIAVVVATATIIVTILS